MSHINEALKKAQKQRDARSLTYGGIATALRKEGAPLGKRVFLGALSVIGLVLLALISFSWLDLSPTQIQTVSENEPPKPAPATRPKAVKDAQAFYDKAKHLHRIGRLEKARMLYQETLRTDPGHVDALNNLGVLYLHNKDFRAAQANFEKAIRLRPRSVDPYYNLACLYSLKGELGQGLAHLEKAVSLDGMAKEWARKDRDLGNLRKMPEFEAIVGGMKQGK
ncbi:MAG: tetratricopeptide repeat protein [Desulfobacteraceae bacterium]|jgi:tetratricopeptide (TPR) repeat protein